MKTRARSSTWTRYGRMNGATALFCVVLIAIVWALTLQRTSYEREAAIADAVRQNSNLAIALEEHTIRTVKSIDQTVMMVAHEYARLGPQLQLRMLIADGDIDENLITLIGVVNERGELVHASVPTKSTYVGDREYFRVQRDAPHDGIFIGKPILGRLTGSWSFQLSRRIVKPDGSFGGVVFASVNPAYFWNFYRQADLGDQGVVTLVGLDGITRARQTGSKATFGEDMQDSTLFSEQSRRLVGTFVSSGKLDGVGRNYSYRTMAQYPLIVAVGTAVHADLAAFRVREASYWLWAGIATAMIVLFGGGLIFALSRHRGSAEALTRSEARFRATFDQAAVGIAHTALDGQFLQVNRALCGILEYSAAELLARSSLDITLKDDRALSTQCWATLRATNVPRFSPEFEQRYVRRDGTIIWVNVSISLVHDANGKPDYFVSVIQDITKRKTAETALRESEARFRTIAENVDEAFWLTDTATGKVLYVSPGHERIWRRSSDAIFGDRMSLLSAVHPDDKAVVEEDIAAANDGRAVDREYRILWPEGSVRWIRSRGFPIRDDAGPSGRYVGIAQDITERKRAEAALYESQEQFQQLAAHIPETFWITDIDRDEVIYISPAYERIFGAPCPSPSNALEQWVNAIHPDDRERAMSEYRAQRGGNVDHEYRIVRPDGSIRWVQSRGFPVRDVHGTVYRMAGTIEDVTERKELQERLLRQAHYDSLTQLPNRALCHDRLKQALGHAQRRDSVVGVLFLDLDRFKTVNDTLGHTIGDELLREVASRLTGCVRAGDTVSRLGGDEFAIILSDLARPTDAGVVADKVIEALARPVDLDGHEIFITASLGVTIFPGDGENAETLIKNADAAMYHAKEVGRNNYQFYTASMNEQAMQKLVFENGLRRALERNEFVLHIQPKTSMANGSITGGEALLRWHSAENGVVQPAQFVGLLEESGLIVKVGEWVIDHACAQIRAWQRAGIAPVPIAVNLSTKQFQHQDICAVVDAALRRHHVDARFLELEITESAAMQNAEAAIVTLRRLKALGVTISIDDFGTGYSSLSYLKRFPVDALKLDRSFVDGLPDDANDASIARAVIAMAHSLGLRVIAEGVETDAQRLFLWRNACDESQGYLCSPPVAIADFTRLLRQHQQLEQQVA